MERLKQGATANDAVEVAIKVLEDASVTNAGIGSNLNRVGLVECDAAIMCSKPDAFGAVGSVSAICNPIEAANAVLKSYAKGPNRHGLVPPMFLVGEGADKWARDHGICTNMDSRHKITEAALRKYEQYMDFVTSPALDKEPETTVGNASENTNALDEDVLLDTVGAVCIDMDKVIAAGVSSGGIALKHPGRIGEAAMFGCGSWAEELTDKTKKPTVLVGTSVTGTGEQIMRTMLAKNCAQPSTDIFTSLSDCFEKFNNSRSLELYTTKNAGIIMVRHDLGSNSTGT
ncbi:taspase, threonine aspartase, 1 [Coemansia sp. RSA 1286]|nr:taspase, threonine aspartase, 1 [Coemansia sp. RSA 1286]